MDTWRGKFGNDLANPQNPTHQKTHRPSRTYIHRGSSQRTPSRDPLHHQGLISPKLHRLTAREMTTGSAVINPEDADLRILEERISTMDRLTKAITRDLGDASRRSGTVSRILHPMAEEARKAEIYERNLQSCMDILDGVKGYVKITTLSQQTIEAGINQVGLDAYMSSVRRLSDMVEELKQCNFTGFPMIMEDAQRLIIEGHNSLKEYYAGILSSGSKVLEPAQLIKGPPVRFEDSTIALIQRLLRFFSSAKVNVNDVYIKVRSDYFQSSLSEINLAVNPQNLSKDGKSNLQLYSKSLKKLIIEENMNLQAIHNNDRTIYVSIFQSVIVPPLNNFTRAIKDLSSYVERNMTTESLLAFQLIEYSGIIILTVSGYVDVPESLIEVFNSVLSTSVAVLTAFISYIDKTVNSLTSLPVDNTPCRATVDIMSRMIQLAAYKKSAATSISNMAENSTWIPTPKPAWCNTFSSALSYQGTDQPNDIELLSTYFSDSLDALLVTLELKAKSLGKTIPQVGFCLLTNYTYIEKCIKNSDIPVILGTTGAERLERLKKRAMNMFLDDWKIVAGKLIEATVLKPGKQVLNSKDKDLIKDKFKIFNTEFDALVQNHKAYNITDPYLKRTLAKEVSSLVSQIYHRFHDKHVADGFTKNISKYIKYDNDQFDKILESLG